jgi:hypothetical protein
LLPEGKSLIACAKGGQKEACAFKSSYANNPTTFSWTEGAKPRVGTRDTHGVFLKIPNNGDFATVENIITIPATDTDTIVRVYTGICSDLPTYFNASLQDGSGSVSIGPYKSKGGGIENQVFTIRVASAKQLGGAGPRVLHTSWSMLAPSPAHAVNLEFQGVAVSTGGALKSPRTIDTISSREQSGATQPFVILQAAQLQ